LFYIDLLNIEIQEIMQNRRAALERLAQKVAGEAQQEVQKSLDQIQVRAKRTLLRFSLVLGS
jgi:hypothetical protein